MTARPGKSSGLTRGFTLIEVMMALTVLAVGVLGVIALGKATVVANLDARQMTTASSVARVWLERLQADATQWNHPSSFRPTSDLTTDTLFLKNYNTGWFLPAGGPGPVVYSSAFDLNGNDIPVGETADVIYCANVRLTTIYNDPLLPPGSGIPSMLRAEVRVYWKKNRSPIGQSSAACSGATSGTTGADPLGGDDDNYHWVYTVAAVGKVTAQ